MDRQKNQKEAIIAEYLAGETTYRKLSAKYKIHFQTIHKWVEIYQGKIRIRKPALKKEIPIDEPPLPLEVKQLRKELRKAQLHNKLLNTMIDIAEERLDIEIRKKSGAKRS
jgi:transposase-like protein